MKMKLFTDLKENKRQAKETAMTALAALEPVYQTWAEFAPEDADPAAVRTAACWEPLYASSEFDAVKQALVSYLPHPFLRNNGTVAFILANDSSLDAEDLFQQCYETVMSRLVLVYRNVSKLYKTKKGMVNKAEGWVLYIDRMVSCSLCDLARRYDSGFGRQSAGKNVLNLYEKAGQEILSANDLQIGESVIRKANRVGTYSGAFCRDGGKYARVDYPDGCTDYIRWERVSESVRRFTGNLQDIPVLQKEDEEKKPKSRSISLDALLSTEDEGVSLMKLIPGGASCEEELLRNEMNDVLRCSYLATAESLQNELASVMMFFYLVHDYLSLQFTHYPEILDKLSHQDPLELARSIHLQNCLMLNIDPGQQVLRLSRDQREAPFTVRQLTVAKNQVKNLFRRNLTRAMAA